MFRKILIVCVLLFGIIAVKAQESNAQTVKLRVAVFDPTSSSTSIDEGTRDAVRELISSTFVNTGKYIIVERSLLQQIIKEQKLSNSDAFDESQATELGRLAGANKVVLSVVSLVGGRNMLSIKLIDVNTATIDQQKTRIVGSNDLLDVVEPLTLNMLGEKSDNDVASQSSRNNGSKKSSNNNSTVSSDDNQDKPHFPPSPFSRKSKDNKDSKNNVSNNQSARNNDSGSGTFSFGNIEVQGSDLFKEKTVWSENLCPDGWRLPTRDELKRMCEGKKIIGNFKTNPFSNYFTGEFDKKGKNIYIRSFDDCKESTENPDKEEAWVRCVRDR